MATFEWKKCTENTKWESTIEYPRLRDFKEGYRHERGWKVNYEKVEAAKALIGKWVKLCQPTSVYMSPPQHQWIDTNTMPEIDIKIYDTSYYLKVTAVSISPSGGNITYMLTDPALRKVVLTGVVRDTFIVVNPPTEEYNTDDGSPIIDPI